MTLMMRTTTSGAARAIAAELAAEGFLARATQHQAIPLVMVCCLADEHGPVSKRIQRRDPGSAPL